MAEIIIEQELKVRKNIHWIFTNLTRSFVVSRKPDESYDSNRFVLMIDDHKTTWCIRFFPNGTSFSDEGYASLFLVMLSSNVINFTAKFKLGIVLPSGDQINSMTFEREANEFQGNDWGIGNFISHETLFYGISNNQLTLSCELSLYTTKPNEIYRNSHGTVRDILPFSDYKDIFTTSILSDFQLRMSDGASLNAHKAVLIARSPVFLAMLTSDMLEAQANSMEVPDFDSATMKELLRFLYTNEVENLDNIALSLIYAAEKYQVEQLKVMCRDNIISKLSTDNIFEALIIAYSVSNMQDLLTQCANLVVRYYKELSTSEKWQTLPSCLLLVLLDAAMKHQDSIVYV